MSDTSLVPRLRDSLLPPSAARRAPRASRSPDSLGSGPSSFSLAQATRLLSDAALVVGVEAFRARDVLRIPAVPLSRLITAEQHDSVLVGVEREQHPYAAIDPRLLQLAETRTMDDVDVRSAERRASGDDPVDRGSELDSPLRPKGRDQRSNSSIVTASRERRRRLAVGKAQP